MNAYTPITSQELEERMNAIRNCWLIFFSEMVKQYKEIKKENDINIEYRLNTEALKEIVDRVYKREDYFIRYHSGMKMSEYKEIGLYAFWIYKFQPFEAYGDNIDEKFCFKINQEFAVYYIFVALKNLAQIQKRKYNSTGISKALYDEIIYCVTFRDISKEAMGLIVELIANIVISE